MNTKRFVLLSIIALSGVSQMVGQENPIPKEPILPKAPPRTVWTVTTRYKAVPTGENKKPPTSVRTIRKEGQLLQEIMERDGVRYESYIVGPLRISDHGEKDTVVSIPPNDETFVFYGDKDFAHLGWLSKDNFRGVDEYEGRKVFVFSIDSKDPGSGGRGNRIAMLDIATQLPVRYSDDLIEETYEFKPAPSTPLVIPKLFKERLAKEVAYRQALQRAGGG